jgi:UPF0755 protein
MPWRQLISWRITSVRRSRINKMKSYVNRSRLPKRILWLFAALLLIIIAGMVVARQVYYNGLKPVDGNQTSKVFSVESGSSVKEIGAELEQQGLIRSAWAFQLYVHRKGLNDKLLAGTYAFSPDQGTEAIVTTLTRGKVATRLVTILPGRRIDQVRADLINYGFTPESVDKALEPAQYADLPALTFKPAEINSLEGLLWPESFQKDATTEPSMILRQSLEEMGKHITPEVQAAFAAQNLTVYQGLILTSIVLQEVDKPADQAQAAQVFMTRLKSGKKLESDATARYGAVLAGKPPSVTYSSAYNTYQNGGLPPTPISTINASSLVGTTHPAGTNWLYFVSGDDGKTYFSTTLEEHEALTRKYCQRNCGN